MNILTASGIATEIQQNFEESLRLAVSEDEFIKTRRKTFASDAVFIVRKLR